MKLKTKAWLVSQGMLVLTAVLIQLTFYREIKFGPLLGMEKRGYWEIISETEPETPTYVLEKNLPPELYDARLPLSEDEIKTANLGAYHLSARQERGLRMAFAGGWIVNLIYFFAYHILVAYFSRAIDQAKKKLES